MMTFGGKVGELLAETSDESDETYRKKRELEEESHLVGDENDLEVDLHQVRHRGVRYQSEHKLSWSVPLLEKELKSP
jgi:hypothetical protein